MKILCLILLVLVVFMDGWFIGSGGLSWGREAVLTVLEVGLLMGILYWEA